MIRSGSLFTGAGMLDCAVSEVLDATPAWFVENDIDAAKALRYHWPDVPNLGDITEVDWSTVAPIEVLTAGFPCQDVSSAGKRLGMRPGSRSGLWSYAAYAISQLSPRLVVIENVRGLLSADAHCDMEPCSWCLGSKRGRPLRALGAVLGDLAGLGYDTQWCGIRASDIGAPHARFRVFIIARPAGAVAERRGPAAAYAQGLGPVREGPTRRRGNGSADHDRFAADPAGPRRGPLQPEHVREDSGETVQAREAESRRCGGVVADADRERLEGRGPAGPPASRPRHPSDPDGPVAAPGSGGFRASEWGIYTAAIRRWELILGRPAPSPTVVGKRGGQQLSPAFVEWLMGWPEGWVTDVPGLSRNAKLKIAGNGVVPQQAAVAVGVLTADWKSAA